ncbi:DNA excision repair protein ERCC-6-like [Diorhabda sublineata]|uniref:DNA excision repair protein ERCC-6-like n=1 Tax=Diorhabda sublineata TaxID=1163346 RepID=UPI0024E12BD0|nr:DNA excision repair protein ERCC-6-like [Diorhabda sublineata]
MEKEDDLKSIFLKENVNVWSEKQSTLEEQALKELEIVARENTEKQNVDISDKQKCINVATVSLDINSYIQRQQNLKKRQDFNRSLNEVSCKTTKIAKKRQKVNATIDTDNYLMADDKGEDKFETDKESNETESGSEYVPSDLDCESDKEHYNFSVSQKQTKRKRSENNIKKIIDDGILENYQSRLDNYYKKLEDEELLKKLEGTCNEEVEYHMLKGGLKVTINIWNKLYTYQQDSLKWLWKLHTKNSGGLLGDEMGLGKTVQIIAFLHSLEYSKISSCHGRFTGLGPSLIVCPATVIYQWLKHFQEWAPEFRVAILHQSGSFHGNKATLIKEMHKSKGIIITTYLGVIKYQTNLLDYNWHYIILDEGHKIRNPTAKATVAIKLFKTPHRIMLTGSPMQNDLTELWSLLDFTNPGLLGNLKTFQEHFSTPILHGGFANSTPMQEATALSVASILKDLISPYLLRRSKQEVQHHILLPNKTEQVLFCSLSDEQKLLYKEYLMDDDVSHILGKGVKNWAADNHVRARVFVAITKLRKICNHPDIYLSETKDDEPSMSSTFGNYKKSGKMIVVSALLKIWKKEGHRVLLFTQTRSMIKIFKDFLNEQGYKYLKMDGTTPISSRQPMIQTFNTDSSYDVFLLTTRVGGLGVNLTGANRVIIYDPDWNPATDTQARERAWRIGQDKQVTIYRLLAAGTIEEKMYQRQVWKQLLSNKILVDPATNKFFKSSDLFDLFSLQESNQDTNPETVNIFHNSRVRIQEKLKEKKSKRKSKTSDTFFSEDKIQQMKLLAQQIARSLTKKPTNLQIELNAEKMEKQEERQEMKTLDVGELLRYNKEKEMYQGTNEFVNKIDDCEAVVGFSEALEYSEKTAKLHNNLKRGKDIDKIVNDVKKAKRSVTKTPVKLITKFKKRKRDKSDMVDTSGKVDGEKIEGVVRREIKKNKRKHKNPSGVNKQQDDFILGKLFQKKGVFGAVQHDSVIQEYSRNNNLKIRTEAKMKAEQSLEALRKSRIDNWKW